MTDHRGATSRLLDVLRRKRAAGTREAAERARIRYEQRAVRDARELARGGADSGRIGSVEAVDSQCPQSLEPSAVSARA